MNQELARYTIRTMFGCARDLQDLLSLLKEHCSKEEFESLQEGIGSVLAIASTEVINKVLASNPGLGEEIESDVQKYGRLL